MAVIELMELTWKEEAGIPPTETPVAPVKFVPVIVTVVPPDVEPLEGLIAVTVGEDETPLPEPLPLPDPTVTVA
jgi:hypothetical protein